MLYCCNCDIKIVLCHYVPLVYDAQNTELRIHRNIKNIEHILLLKYASVKEKKIKQKEKYLCLQYNNQIKNEIQ